MEPIESLARDDTWYLGCGEGVIFASPFPLWLDAPGFWDEAQFYQYTVGPLFTITILDHDGRELALAARRRRWTAAELTVDEDSPGGLTATEIRTVQSGRVFASKGSLHAPRPMTLHAPRPMTLHAVAWTAQDGAAAKPSMATMPLARGESCARSSITKSRTARSTVVSTSITCKGPTSTTRTGSTRSSPSMRCGPTMTSSLRCINRLPDTRNGWFARAIPRGQE